VGSSEQQQQRRRLKWRREKWLMQADCTIRMQQATSAVVRQVVRWCGW
jgi:hypothetical protein